MSNLTHIDDTGQAVMVDVGGKLPTHRTAIAQCIVHLPNAVFSLLQGNELHTPKGAVFQTAIIAGIMAAKRTGDLIPLCHPLGLENCRIEIKAIHKNELLILCTASITAKTGVEMEALTGASIAALTIYDMCKAISHDIVIKELQLVEKTGGKNDFKRK